MEAPKVLKRVQELPLRKRKIIFWIIILISGLIMFFFWVWHVKNTIKDFQTDKFLEDINLPELQEELQKGLPGPPDNTGAP